MCDVIGIYGRRAWMREEKNRFWANIHRRLFLLLFSSPNRLWLSTPLRPISQPLTRWHRCARNARLIEVSWRRQRFTLIATLSAAEPTKSWVNLRTSSSAHTTLMTLLSPSSKAHPFRFLSPKPVLKQTTKSNRERIEADCVCSLWICQELWARHRFGCGTRVRFIARRYFVFLRFLDPKIVHCWKAWSTHDVRRRAASEISRNCLSFLIRFNEARHLWWFVFFRHFARPLSGFFLADWKGRVE